MRLSKTTSIREGFFNQHNSNDSIELDEKDKEVELEDWQKMRVAQTLIESNSNIQNERKTLPQIRTCFFLKETENMALMEEDANPICRYKKKVKKRF